MSRLHPFSFVSPFRCDLGINGVFFIFSFTQNNVWMSFYTQPIYYEIQKCSTKIQTYIGVLVKRLRSHDVTIVTQSWSVGVWVCQFEKYIKAGVFCTEKPHNLFRIERQALSDGGWVLLYERHRFCFIFLLNPTAAPLFGQCTHTEIRLNHDFIYWIDKIRAEPVVAHALTEAKIPGLY